MPLAWKIATANPVTGAATRSTRHPRIALRGASYQKKFLIMKGGSTKLHRHKIVRVMRGFLDADHHQKLRLLP